jgi:hypothetical protein
LSAAPRGNMETAKRVRGDMGAPATAVFLATKVLFKNDQFLAWEPESIWLEFKDHSVNLSLENRDKLSAVITLIQDDAFHWDATVFENTMLAFNDIPSAPDAIQEASPGEISWGVFEAEILSMHAGHGEDYDYEPAKYTAASLNRGGFLLAPELLVFCQDELDGFNRGSADLKSVVAEKWQAVDFAKLRDLDLSEDPVDVHLGRLAAVHLHVEQRAQRLRREVEQFQPA